MKGQLNKALKLLKENGFDKPVPEEVTVEEKVLYERYAMLLLATGNEPNRGPQE